MMMPVAWRGVDREWWGRNVLPAGGAKVGNGKQPFFFPASLYLQNGRWGRGGPRGIVDGSWLLHLFTYMKNENEETEGQPGSIS